MSLNVFQIVGLLALALIIPTYQVFRNWQAHKNRQQLADARQWRYSNRGWRAVFQSTYSLSGSTPSGVVWQLKRVNRDKQLWLIWTASTRLLPYGRLVIQPRQVASNPAELERLNLRSMKSGSQEWQQAYKLLATHDVLCQRFFNREIELVMLDWPAWPEAGALFDIIWQSGQLRIRCRYHHDPLTLEKIAILGTTLIENGVRQKQASESK